MAKRMLTGSIDVTKITKEKLYKGKNGQLYCNIIVWIDEENKDQFGNVAAIAENRGKDEKDKKPNYLGNLKLLEKKENTQNTPVNNTVSDIISDISKDDLPF